MSDEAEAQANARLIAVADMLAALQAVEEWWLRDGMNYHFGAPYAIFAARAAIERAVALEIEAHAEDKQ